MLGSIYKSSILACLFLLTSSLGAANKKIVKPTKIPLYQGVTVGVEVLQPALGLLSKQSGLSGKIDLNLRNNYFPTLEIGHAVLDRTAENGTQGLANGTYFKLGVNKALTSFGTHAENQFFAGAHYGLSSFQYQVKQLNWADSYWNSSLPSNMPNQWGLAGWFELVVGVRVDIGGPFSMGWTGQYKTPLHVSKGDMGFPPLIPGYGENLKPQTGFAVHFYYRLPF